MIGFNDIKLYVFISLSLFPFNLGVILFVVVFLVLLHFYHIFGVGLPAYLSNHSPFSREHIF